MRTTASVKIDSFILKAVPGVRTSTRSRSLLIGKCEPLDQQAVHKQIIFLYKTDQFLPSEKPDCVRAPGIVKLRP